MTGNRLCCTSLQRGTIVMDANGTNREVLTRDGWGAQWSPNGKWIAYESQQSVNGQNCRNITLIDVATRQTQQILRGADASRYSYIYYNMEWSPDSEQICFKGAFSGGREIAIVNIADGSIRQISTMDIQPDFSWHPDGRTILMSGPLTQLGGVEVGAPYSSKGNRLYVYDVTAETLRLLPGQPMNQSSTNVAWSPDGRQIAFISRIYPTPTRWTGTAESPKVR
jgi:Tol biopolymer transport system component